MLYVLVFIGGIIFGMIIGGALTKLAEANSVISKFYSFLDIKEIDDGITIFLKIEKTSNSDENENKQIITKEESWRYN
jgi:hypothetical protein